MKQYIDKSAVIAEIGKLQNSTMDEDGNFYSVEAQAEYDILCVLENSINNIEVEHDTFIEKACEFIKERLIFDDNAWYVDGEITLKDKVTEDFRNYMKGK